MEEEGRGKRRVEGRGGQREEEGKGKSKIQSYPKQIHLIGQVRGGQIQGIQKNPMTPRIQGRRMISHAGGRTAVLKDEVSHLCWTSLTTAPA